MIVEERGIGFWTRVRLPSSPLNHSHPNSVFFVKHCFGFVFTAKSAHLRRKRCGCAFLL